MLTRQTRAAVANAQRALEAALRQCEAGRAPLAGERAGLAGGGSRLREAYFERQRQLELDVALAQWRLDRALARRNDLE